MSPTKVRNQSLALSLSQSSERRSFPWIETIISIDQHDHIPFPFDHEIVSLECYSACWTLMAMIIKRPKHSTSAVHACNPVIMQNTARSSSIPSPYPLRFQLIMIVQPHRHDHAGKRLQSLATSRDNFINSRKINSREIGRCHSNTRHALQ